MKTYNMNSWCRVELTQYGKDILKKLRPETFAGCGSYDPKTGIYEAELWSIMSDFAEFFYSGNPSVPFVNNSISISEKNI